MAQDLFLYITAVGDESVIQSEFIVVDDSDWRYRNDLIEQANVSYNEWLLYEARVTGIKLRDLRDDCWDSIEYLKDECGDCVSG